MALPHKDIVFPEVDLSGDEGDPEWGGQDFIPEGHHLRWVRPPGLYASVWSHTQEQWQETAAGYEANPDDFYESWHYLNGHPIYWRFIKIGDRPANHESGLETDYGFGSDAINVHIARVCTECGRHHAHDEAPPPGVKTEVWLETGKWSMFPESDGASHTNWHDTELDCGGDTYEQAVIELARNVWEKYGNDRQIADAPEPQLDR